MFDRGIKNDKFVEALKKWNFWEAIVSDRDLFIGIRNEYINIYFQGCSLFKISYSEDLVFETHYKYLIYPNMKNPYILWRGDCPAVRERVDEIFIHEFSLNLLKKSARWYAEAEKVGLHGILRNNNNVVDVEVALSPEAEVETESEERASKVKHTAARIDFAAIQEKDGKPRIVFFEAKRFDNGELRTPKGKPRVIDQIGRYEAFIAKYQTKLEESYRTVCKNLVDLIPERVHPLVKAVACHPEELTVDRFVRLVVFDFDQDQNIGKVWLEHKNILVGHFGSRLLLKGSTSEFRSGISKYNLDVAA